MYPRFIEPGIREALKDTRVVAVAGPRQSGKSTLVRAIAGEGATFLSLDEDVTRRAASVGTSSTGSAPGSGRAGSRVVSSTSRSWRRPCHWVRASRTDGTRNTAASSTSQPFIHGSSRGAGSSAGSADSGRLFTVVAHGVDDRHREP